MKAVARHMYTHLQSLVAQNDTEHASEVKVRTFIARCWILTYVDRLTNSC